MRYVGILVFSQNPHFHPSSISALTPSNIVIPRGQNLTFQCAPDPEHLPVTHHRLKLHIANKTILPDSNGDFNVQNVSLELSDTYAQCMVYSDNDDDPLTVGQPAYVQVCCKFVITLLCSYRKHLYIVGFASKPFYLYLLECSGEFYLLILLCFDVDKLKQIFKMKDSLQCDYIYLFYSSDKFGFWKERDMRILTRSCQYVYIYILFAT